MAFVDTISRTGGQIAEGSRGVAGYVTHTGNRIANHTGMPGAWESISKSGFGQFVGRHKIAAGAVAVGTVAAVAYNHGRHREQALHQARSHGMER